jgi:hypothetical protein
MYLLPRETRVSDPCPRRQDQRGRNPGLERAGATAAAHTIREPAAQRKPCASGRSPRTGLGTACGQLPVPSAALTAARSPRRGRPRRMMRARTRAGAPARVGTPPGRTGPPRARPGGVPGERGPAARAGWARGNPRGYRPPGRAGVGLTRRAERSVRRAGPAGGLAPGSPPAVPRERLNCHWDRSRSWVSSVVVLDSQYACN